jgi:hypothetical protein
MLRLIHSSINSFIHVATHSATQSLKRILIICGGMCLLTNIAFADVWPTLNRWESSSTPNCQGWPQNSQAVCKEFVATLSPGSDWETIYSKWVEKFWTTEALTTDKSLLEGLPHDCADASYAMRTYFSYLFRLEFKINNPEQSGTYITNSMKSYDRFANQEDRFRHFMVDIFKNTNTRTLPEDTYPIAINQRVFRPGIIYVAVAPGNHSLQIASLDKFGYASTLSSTVPPEPKPLSELHSLPFYAPSDFASFRDGYRAFKQPKHFSMPQTSLPGFSLEQFKISKSILDKWVKKATGVTAATSIYSFQKEIQTRLQLEEPPLMMQLEGALQDACHFTRIRNQIVLATLEIKPKSCIKDFNFYDSYSTPDRDQELSLIFEKAQTLYRILGRFDTRTIELLFPLTTIERERLSDRLKVLHAIFDEPSQLIGLSEDYSQSWCSIEPTLPKKDRQLSLRRTWQAISESRLVADPNGTFTQRWGLAPFLPVCPVPKETH